MTEEAGFEALVQGASRMEEGGIPYVLLPQLRLPAGCTPQVLDALLCLGQHGGYPTRLFLAEKVTVPGKSPNWNATGVHILGRNWVAASWGPVPSTLSPMEVLLNHLDAFR